MTWKQRASISLLLLGHFACVAFSSLVINAPLFAFALTGIIFGQVILIAAWMTLSTQGQLSRLTSGGLLATSLWLALMIAFRLNDPNESPTAVALLIAVHLCTAITTACMPLWIARLRGKWQIRPPRMSGAPQQQFTLRYTLVLMGLVCILLALGRLVLTPSANEAARVNPDIPYLAFTAAIGTAMVAFVSTLMVLTGLYAYFHTDQFDVAFTLVGAPACAILGTVVCWITVALFVGPLDEQGIFGLFGLQFGQFATVAVTMSWLRRSGFILNRGQNGTTPGDAGATPDGPSADLTTPGLPPLHPLSHL